MFETHEVILHVDAAAVKEMKTATLSQLKEWAGTIATKQTMMNRKEGRGFLTLDTGMVVGPFMLFFDHLLYTRSLAMKWTAILWTSLSLVALSKLVYQWLEQLRDFVPWR